VHRQRRAGAHRDTNIELQAFAALRRLIGNRLRLRRSKIAQRFTSRRNLLPQQALNKNATAPVGKCVSAAR
jgi:hypothetical protein